jgi:hypothetical protein
MPKSPLWVGLSRPDPLTGIHGWHSVTRAAGSLMRQRAAPGKRFDDTDRRSRIASFGTIRRFWRATVDIYQCG